MKQVQNIERNLLNDFQYPMFQTEKFTFSPTVQQSSKTLFLLRQFLFVFKKKRNKVMYFIECDHVKNLFNLMVFLTLKTQPFALEK